MQKISLALEYHCLPLWLYDDNDELIDNTFPPEVQKNKELCELLNTIQKRYDALFIDTPIEFAYIGFQNDNEKQAFANLIEKALEQLSIILEGHYEIENQFELD